MAAEYGSVPFAEAEEFFAGKLRIPTQRWDDLWQGQHAKGFMIAGAQRDDMLCDFQAALLKAIAEGTSLEEFRRDFDDIVARYGWSYNGSRGWRSRVIYDTNMRTAYMAGRYKQMTDPDVLAYRPYWQYRHGDSRVPRPLHLAWDGMVLNADDAWWSTHFPPNGWGCKCSVVPLSERGLARTGRSGPDEAPPIEIDPKTGAPIGIDKGWDYNIGEAAWGKRLSDAAMAEWQAHKGEGDWQRLTPGDWRSAGRPERLPVDPARAATGPRLDDIAATGPRLDDIAAATEALAGIMGGDERIFTLPTGDKMLVNANVLAGHINLNRTPYLTLLPETLEEPYEIWLSFEQHKWTGKIELRQRLIKLVDVGEERGMLVVGQARNGMLEAWTMIPPTDLKYLNRQRAGKLVWGRE